MVQCKFSDLNSRQIRLSSATRDAKRDSPRLSGREPLGLNGIKGLVRAHGPVSPFGLASTLPREPGRRLCQDVVLLPSALVGPSMRLPASRLLGPPHPSGNRLCSRLELTRQLFGRASRWRQIDHLSPELRRISGSISRHSDASKINFKDVHQTGSTPPPPPPPPPPKSNTQTVDCHAIDDSLVHAVCSIPQASRHTGC